MTLKQNKALSILDWEYQQLHAGAGVGSTVYRFSGQASDQGQTVPWSLILKTIQPNDLDCEPSAWNYCKREADAYQSGWLGDLPGGLAAPACYGVVEHLDGGVWVWLEEVVDDRLVAVDGPPESTCSIFIELSAVQVAKSQPRV